MHHFNVGIYAPRKVSVKDIGSQASMVLQKYQSFIEMTSNMINIVALGVGLKCPRKIHLNTHCPPLIVIMNKKAGKKEKKSRVEAKCKQKNGWK